MKWLYEWIIGTYETAFDEFNSFYLFITSMLASIVLSWAFYPTNVAIVFSILLAIAILTVCVCGFLKSDLEDILDFQEGSEELLFKKEKTITIILDVILVVIMAAMCIVNFKLAACLIGFNAGIQLFIWIVKERISSYQRLERLPSGSIVRVKNTVSMLTDIFEFFISIIMPIALNVSIISLWFTLSINPVIRWIVLALYILIAIPIILRLRDEMNINHMYEITGRTNSAVYFYRDKKKKVTK